MFHYRTPAAATLVPPLGLRRILGQLLPEETAKESLLCLLGDYGASPVLHCR